jgi:hypothetical protein
MLALLMGLSGCLPGGLTLGLPDLSNLPAMPWDGHPQGKVWTAATRMAVAAQDAVLASQVPADIGALCPGYAAGGLDDRRAFWVALVALTAKVESGFNPAVVARGGYVGLMQIAPATARAMGCSATSKAELQDGENNLFCAVTILAGKVAQDGAALGARGTQGIGRDWGPWRQSGMRSGAADWLRRQAYCR